MPFKAPTVSEPLRSDLQHAHAARHDQGYDPLYALAFSAREVGWSLGSLAEVVGVTRESIRQWANRGEQVYGSPPLTVTPPPTPPMTKAEQNRAERTMARLVSESREDKMIAARLPRLLEVKEVAESLRGPSSHSPEKAAASAEYTALIHECLDAGIRATRLAKALDIEVVTIYARLRRGGYRPLAPSEVEHQRFPSWSPVAEAAMAS